jgi:biopolymer transport protein ExbD
MRIPGVRTREASSLGVNMTSMIDVVFLLLIFFLCTANFQTLEELLPATLRAPGTTADLPAVPELEDLEEVVIRITQPRGRPRWEINGTAYDEWNRVRAILAELARIHAAVPVILDVDREVPLGQMIDVYDACRLARFTDIRFAAEAH